MTGAPSLSWVHIGDLHMDEATDWESRDRLAAIVAEINEQVGDAAAFVYLPGDNANHASAEQYRVIVETLAPLRLPYRVIPGDHDFELGDLVHYNAAFPQTSRPEVEVVAGQVPVVFMHAYPGDLAAEAEDIARIFADARVAFVDTGHTHYNELLNDGRVVDGATRSTGEIEEGGGRPGFSIVTVHGRVPSWRFKETGGAWPFVQIVSPADLRLVTRPADPTQVPRPGAVEIVAKLFGPTEEPVMLSIDGDAAQRMVETATGLWTARVSLSAGLHRVEATVGSDRDVIEVLVRGEADIPRRGLPIAPGRDIHSIGAWPEHGIPGGQLGPNRNGRHW